MLALGASRCPRDFSNESFDRAAHLRMIRDGGGERAGAAANAELSILLDYIHVATERGEDRGRRAHTRIEISASPTANTHRQSMAHLGQYGVCFLRGKRGDNHVDEHSKHRSIRLGKKHLGVWV